MFWIYFCQKYVSLNTFINHFFSVIISSKCVVSFQTQLSILCPFFSLNPSFVNIYTFPPFRNLFHIITSLSRTLALPCLFLFKITFPFSANQTFSPRKTRTFQPIKPFSTHISIFEHLSFPSHPIYLHILLHILL